MGLDDADWDVAMDLVGSMDRNELNVAANPPPIEVRQPSSFPLAFNAPETKPQREIPPDAGLSSITSV